MVKGLDFFFKATTSSLIVKFFFVLLRSYSMSPVCLAHHEQSFVPTFFLRSLLIMYLITLSLEMNYCFGKKSGKSLVVWI